MRQHRFFCFITTVFYIFRKVHGLMKRRPIVKNDKAKSIKIPVEEDGTLTNPVSGNNAKNKSKKV